MIYADNIVSRTLNLLVGAVVFFIVVTGLTYYLQSSLLVKSLYHSETKWYYYHLAAILLVVPIIAGVIQRLLSIVYPLLSTLLGAIAATYVLHILYSTLFWAEPPTTLVTLIYMAIIFGMGYIATQPLKTTFMMAFRIGRFSVPGFSSSSMNKKPMRKADMSKTQRMQAHGGRSDLVALMELLIGVVSLALSIFSIFILGKG